MPQTLSEDILYGIHPVQAVIAAGRREVRQIYVSSATGGKKRFDRLLSLAETAGIPVAFTSEHQLGLLTGSEAHQGTAARVGAYPYVPLADMLAMVSNRESRPLFLLIIDSVTDPHNLGALVRTAVCVEAAGIVIPKNNAAPPTAAACKASAGALEFAAVARETNVARTVDFLKKNGIWVAGLAAEAGQSLYESDLTGSVALVVGGENKGIRRLVKEKCDFLMAVPQTPIVQSLNVSVAGGIAMYERYRQCLAQQKYD